ncbi:MAG: hypothetical protein ACJA2N_002076, partial [Salibacteraceae bacterium]
SDGVSLSKEALKESIFLVISRTYKWSTHLNINLDCG